MGERYEAFRKPWIAGRLHLLFRAQVWDNESGSLIEAQSLKLAEQIAALLNDADRGEVPRPIEREAPYDHYQCIDDLRGQTLISRVGWADAPQIARTKDETLARQVADLLNRVDPAKRVRVRRVPWWF